MQRIRNAQAGFTRVELLIVVIIVAILAALAIPLYRGATGRAYRSEADPILGKQQPRGTKILFQHQR